MKTFTRPAWRGLAALAFTAASTTGAVAGSPPTLRLLSTVSAPNPVASELLAAHNRARDAAGELPLSWDSSLAEGAAQYADFLAQAGQLRHSPAESRQGLGENLWMGTRNYFRPTSMVDAWASERSMFRAATFPDVSTTGNWAQVGHYTQMIWPATQRVGCAIGKGPRADVLVCRYFPAGNVMGSPVG